MQSKLLSVKNSSSHYDFRNRWESLVLGPALSPYAFGFFSFKVQFPEDYPSCAPHVVFLTTAGGKTRFNPNLYADGKVSACIFCLERKPIISCFHCASCVFKTYLYLMCYPKILRFV